MPLTRVGKWAVLYGIVAVEVVVLTGSYLQWNKLNLSQGGGSLTERIELAHLLHNVSYFPY